MIHTLSDQCTSDALQPDAVPPCRGARGGNASRATNSSRSTSTGRGNRNAAGSRTGNNNGAPPRCPVHGLEVQVLTANTAANAGRTFYKCAHPSEGAQCLPFAWADEYDGGSGGGRGARGRGQGQGRGML